MPLYLWNLPAFPWTYNWHSVEVSSAYLPYVDFGWSTSVWSWSWELFCQLDKISLVLQCFTSLLSFMLCFVTCVVSVLRRHWLPAWDRHLLACLCQMELTRWLCWSFRHPESRCSWNFQTYYITFTVDKQLLEQLSWLLGMPSGPKISMDRFFWPVMNSPEKRLNGQSEVFYFTANENSEIITNCALTKVVSMLKNKDMLICLPLI